MQPDIIMILYLHCRNKVLSTHNTKSLCIKSQMFDTMWRKLITIKRFIMCAQLRTENIATVAPTIMVLGYLGYFWLSHRQKWF